MCESGEKIERGEDRERGRRNNWRRECACGICVNAFGRYMKDVNVENETVKLKLPSMPALQYTRVYMVYWGCKVSL